jgi:hypothetical protein
MVDVAATEALVAAYDKLVRRLVEGHDGYVYATIGDGLGATSRRASDADGDYFGRQPLWLPAASVIWIRECEEERCTTP